MNFQGLIAGLLDEEEFLLQIGVTVSLQHDSLRVYTRSVDGVGKVEFGQIKLTTDGRELGFLEY
jgi:polynucleotide 5'-kinase involved in rRNA processing